MNEWSDAINEEEKLPKISKTVMALASRQAFCLLVFTCLLLCWEN